MRPWHFRFARPLIYVAASVAAVAVAVTSAVDSPDIGHTLVAARQLYGLWALAILLASLIIGPLTSVLPWLALKPSLMYGRRATGISALGFALLHVGCYAVAVLRRTWRELSTLGVL